MVLRRIGRIEYIVSAMIGPRSPTPMLGTEMKIANRASDGIVSMIDANPRMRPRSTRTRWTRIPSTTEMTIANSIDMATSCTCSTTRSKIGDQPSASDIHVHQLE